MQNKKIKLTPEEKETLEKFELSFIGDRLESGVPLMIGMIKILNHYSSKHTSSPTDRERFTLILNRWEAQRGQS